jgi:hypothetical protein
MDNVLACYSRFETEATKIYKSKPYPLESKGDRKVLNSE